MNNLQFGLTITTHYMGNSSKIKATIKHGMVFSNDKTTNTTSYDHSLGSLENHHLAATQLINKMIHLHDKQFEIIAYSYNEKDTGYNFIVKRVN